MPAEMFGQIFGVSEPPVANLARVGLGMLKVRPPIQIYTHVNAIIDIGIFYINFRI